MFTPLAQGMPIDSDSSQGHLLDLYSCRYLQVDLGMHICAFPKGFQWMRPLESLAIEFVDCLVAGYY